MASSPKGESSYSYLTDYDVGLSLVDRFTFATLDFFEKVDAHSAATLGELFSVYRWAPRGRGRGLGFCGRRAALGPRLVGSKSVPILGPLLALRRHVNKRGSHPHLATRQNKTTKLQV